MIMIASLNREAKEVKLVSVAGRGGIYAEPQSEYEY